jgi:translation initiation factor IF-2
MQQRRVRLGDILDDYCPRERRITNHAVVAMIEDEVKQTRCTTCDADHEYKQAKVPVSRRKKPEPALVVAASEGAAFARPPVPDPEPPVVIEEALTAPIDLLDVVPEPQAVDPEPTSDPESEPEPSEQPDDEWPVHRPLIRATLPRPDGQVPERKAPDFTIRQNGRFDGRNGNRHRGQRHAQGQSRFGNSRSGGGGHGQSGHGQRHGNRPQGGQRGGGRPSGQGRGPGGGRGPKRGR